jgi:hypothetical protein
VGKIGRDQVDDYHRRKGMDRRQKAAQSLRTSRRGGRFLHGKREEPTGHWAGEEPQSLNGRDSALPRPILNYDPHLQESSRAAAPAQLSGQNLRS